MAEADEMLLRALRGYEEAGGAGHTKTQPSARSLRASKARE